MELDHLLAECEAIAAAAVGEQRAAAELRAATCRCKCCKALEARTTAWATEIAAVAPRPTLGDIEPYE